MYTETELCSIVIARYVSATTLRIVFECPLGIPESESYKL